MSMGEIKEILKNYSSRNLFTITLRMLTDHDNNSVNLPESEEIIKKTKSIYVIQLKKQRVTQYQENKLIHFLNLLLIV